MLSGHRPVWYSPDWPVRHGSANLDMEGHNHLHNCMMDDPRNAPSVVPNAVRVGIFRENLYHILRFSPVWTFTAVHNISHM